MQKKVYEHAVKNKKHFYFRPFFRMRYLFTSMAVVIGYCNNLYEFTRCKHKTTLACKSVFLSRICVRYNSHNLDQGPLITDGRNSNEMFIFPMGLW